MFLANLEQDGAEQNFKGKPPAAGICPQSDPEPTHLCASLRSRPKRNSLPRTSADSGSEPGHTLPQRPPSKDSKSRERSGMQGKQGQGQHETDVQMDGQWTERSEHLEVDTPGLDT